MADIVGSRLEKLIEDRRLSQSAVARLIGVSQPSIGRLISGETRKSSKIIELARVLETTPEYLIGERDNPDQGYTPTPPSPELASDLGLSPVKEIDLTFGMGVGYIDDAFVEDSVRYFPTSWLRELTRTAPEHLVFARAKGDSMKPTLTDGDIVIIDMQKNSIREQDAVWAVAVGQIAMVKRIWANADGSYKIKSDNPNVDAEIAVDGEMHVMGQIVGKIGKL